MTATWGLYNDLALKERESEWNTCDDRTTHTEVTSMTLRKSKCSGCHAYNTSTGKMNSRIKCHHASRASISHITKHAPLVAIVRWQPDLTALRRNLSAVPTYALSQ